MEHDPFIADFPIKTSIYGGFSMAMLVITRGYHLRIHHLFPWIARENPRVFRKKSRSPSVCGSCPRKQTRKPRVCGASKSAKVAKSSWRKDWLVVEPHPSEKYERQLGWWFPIYGKIKNVPNHQPDGIRMGWIMIDPADPYGVVGWICPSIRFWSMNKSHGDPANVGMDLPKTVWICDIVFEKVGV